MVNSAGESDLRPLLLGFGCRPKFEFRSSRIPYDASLLEYRELDDAPDLAQMAGGVLGDNRTVENGRRGLVGLPHRSVYGRLAGYEDVSDPVHGCKPLNAVVPDIYSSVGSPHGGQEGMAHDGHFARDLADAAVSLQHNRGSVFY